MEDFILWISKGTYLYHITVNDKDIYYMTLYIGKLQLEIISKHLLATEYSLVVCMWHLLKWSSGAALWRTLCKHICTAWKYQGQIKRMGDFKKLPFFLLKNSWRYGSTSFAISFGLPTSALYKRFCILSLGRCWNNRRSQNLGNAKKGGGVGPLPRFFRGFDIVYRGQPKVMMDPQKWWYFPR